MFALVSKASRSTAGSGYMCCVEALRLILVSVLDSAHHVGKAHATAQGMKQRAALTSRHLGIDRV